MTGHFVGLNGADMDFRSDRRPKPSRIHSNLGIDPAWIKRQASGTGILDGEDEVWRCEAIAPSHGHFLAIGTGILVDWLEAPTPGNQLRTHWSTPLPCCEAVLLQTW